MPRAEYTPEQNQMRQAEKMDELTVAIPVVIKDFELRPVDVFIYQDKYYPLNKRNWETQTKGYILDGKARASAPAPAITDITYPPIQARGYNYSRIALAEERNINDRHFTLSLGNTMYKKDMDNLRRHLENDETAVAAYAKNRTIGVVKKIVDARTVTERGLMNAELDELPPNVIKVCKVRGNLFRLCCSSDTMYAPKEVEKDYNDTVHCLEALEPNIRKLLDAGRDFVIINRTSGKANPVCLEDLDFEIKNITEDGSYCAITSGEEVIQGVAFTNVVNLDGAVVDCKLFTDGNYFTCQDQIAAEKKGDWYPIQTSSFYPNANGTFWWEDEDGRYALLPFSIKSTFRENGKDIINAVDYWKNSVRFVVTPEVRKIVSGTGIKNTRTNEIYEGQIYYIPTSLKFMALGRRKDFLEDWRSVRNLFSKNLRKRYMTGRFQENEGLEITHLGDGRYCAKGKGVEDVCSVPEKHDIDSIDLTYILAVLGCGSEEIASVIKKVKNYTKVTIGGLKRIKFPDIEKMSGEVTDMCEGIKACLYKEASILHDEDSVDKLLSLNFINARNIQEFIHNLPAFEHVERKLAELLILARIGLRDIPEEGVSNALASISKVNKQLAKLRDMIEAGDVEESEQEAE
jgi:hypothetical protein